MSKFTLIVILIMLMLFPILFVLFLEIKNIGYSKDKFKKNLTHILKNCINIFLILALITIIISSIVNQELTNDLLNNLKHLILYYMLLIFEVYFLLFFGMRNNIWRKNIQIFFDSLIYYFKHNIILNMFIVILCIFLKPFNNIVLSLIGSYIFYLLTEVNKDYRDKKQSQIQTNKPLDVEKIELFIFITVLILFLGKIEKLYNCIINEKMLELEYGIETGMVTLILITILTISHAVDYYKNTRKTHIS